MATTSKTHIGDDGFTMDFSLDVVSDIEQDVEDVARQGALGNFCKARRMYEEALKMHRDKFPIYAEFLRLCLDSGDWDSLAKPPDCGSENWSYLAAKSSIFCVSLEKYRNYLVTIRYLVFMSGSSSAPRLIYTARLDP
jgi:hypothetical protein